MSEGYWEVLRDGWIEEDCVSWLYWVILVEGRDGGASLLLGNGIEVLGCMEDWVDREGMMFLEVYRGEFVFVDE